MYTLSKNWLIAAVILYLLAAWFSIGHYHDDEYAQVLHFATAKAGIDLQSRLMWEFDQGIRSGFQPFVAYVLAELTRLLKIDSPYFLAFVYRLLSAVISLVATLLFIKVISKEIKSETAFKWTAFFLLFSWILLFINVRFSSEGWATSFFLLGLSVYLMSPEDSVKRYLAIGFLLGLGFLARYQTGFMLLGLGLWMIFIHKIKPINLVYILAAGFTVLLIGAGFDWWLYGTPTVAAWEYFIWHFTGLQQGGISETAPEPWYFYIQYGAVQLLPPITLLLPLFILLFWIFFPRHPITWLTLPFVLFHQYFGHKEMRYLFPVLPFAPFMVTMVLTNLAENFNLLRNKLSEYCWKFILGVSVLLNGLLVILVLSIPASKEVALWQYCLTSLADDNKPILLVLDTDGSGADTAELNLDFYNKNKLMIDSVRDENEILPKSLRYPGKTLYYAARKKDRSKQLDHAGLQYELICQALPDWMLKINFNNWTSRTSMWRIWSVELN